MLTEARCITLRGATGRPRLETYGGREHLVVPVIALMEGVIHAVNSPNPEFVPGDKLTAAAHTWNGRSLVIGHPAKSGLQISANDPRVLESQAFGTIFKSETVGKKLSMEAWVDPQRLEALGQQELLKRIRNGDPVEVSVGAYVKTLEKEGVYNGKSYKAEWGDISGDHLAFLPDGIGACSLEMGCGSGRHASAYLVTAEGLQEQKGSMHERVKQFFRMLRDIPQAERDKMSSKDFAGPDESFPIEKPEDVSAASHLIGKADNPDAVKAKIISIAKRKGPEFVAQLPEAWRSAAASTLLPDESLSDRDRKVSAGLKEEFGSGSGALASPSDSPWPREVYDDHVIVSKGDKLYSIDYQLDDDGDVEFTSDPVEVKAEYVAAASGDKMQKKMDCTDCKGTGSKDGNPCDTCNGKGYTMKGAETAPIKAACRCGGSDMNKAERIAALLKSDSTLTQSHLETLTEDGLKALETAYAKIATLSAETAKQATALTSTQAEVTALKAAASKQLTEEEFLATAPDSIRTLVATAKAADEAEKTDLVTRLTAASKGGFTADELKAKDLPELRKLAAFAGEATKQLRDFSGRALPVTPTTSDPNDLSAFTPPDPFAADLAALRAANAR